MSKPVFHNLYSQLVLDICRGPWLLHNAEAHLPLVQAFFSRVAPVVELQSFTPLAIDASGEYIDSEEGKPSAPKEYVAVIPIVGTITKYDSCATIGATTLAESLHNAAIDSEVVGVVLDIDSGGGSCSAIPIMREAITAVRNAGKPIITHADLFNAAVDHVAEARIAPLNAQIRALQDTINTLAAQPEDDPVPQAVGQGTAPTALRVNMKAAINRMASSYLSTGLMPEVSASTLDITELTDELGTYLSQGNNLDLLSELYHVFTTSKHLNWKRAVSEYKAVQSHITSVVQRFKPEWNAKGEYKFTVLTVKNNRLKANFPVVAAEVGESWLYHLYDEKKTPQEMPITRYIVQNVLMPSIVNDIELKMIAKGKYNEGLDTPEASMDGFETILVNARKSLDKGIRFFNTDVNLRTATDAEVVETIDDFVASIAPLYQGIKMPLFCSREIYMKYKRGYKAKWGAGSGTEKVQFGEDTIDFSNCHLVVLESMYGSPIIFSTPPENFVGLQYKNPPTFITDIQKQDYMLKYFCEFWLGVGFLIGEAVFAICPEDYDPQASIASEGFDARDKWIVTSEDTQGDLSEEGA